LLYSVSLLLIHVNLECPIFFELLLDGLLKAFEDPLDVFVLGLRKKEVFAHTKRIQTVLLARASSAGAAIFAAAPAAQVILGLVHQEVLPIGLILDGVEAQDPVHLLLLLLLDEAVEFFGVLQLLGPILRGFNGLWAFKRVLQVGARGSGRARLG
jgi:hypothetical protein